MIDMRAQATIRKLLLALADRGQQVVNLRKLYRSGALVRADGEKV